MSDDEHEAFEINDTDFEYAMNPGRNRRNQTREQATYGVFAPQHDSDDDDAGPSRGGPFKKSRYTAPVGFVSGGVQQGSKKIDKDDPESLKLGTFSSKSEDVKKEEEEEEAIQINFDRRTKRVQKEQGAKVFAGMRSSTTKGAMDTSSFGSFLKHGNGSVVMKMMQSMGWKGEGLGAHGQGIVEPVQAALRQGRGAVGAYGKEATGPKFGESAAEAQKRIGGQGKPWQEDQENAEQVIKIKGSWKKSQKAKTKYRTIEDVLEEGVTASRPSGGANSQYSSVKVIDMTGKQQKVYSGYDSFSMKTRSEYQDVDEEERTVFDVPELIHNLNLLVDLTEEGIRRSNQQLIGLKDQTTALEYDLEQIQKTLETEEREAKHMNDVFELIEGFSSNRSPTMSECQYLFRRLRSEYAHEYQLYSLESVSIPIVLPLILRHFSTWNPLVEKDYGTDLISEWREILEEKKGGKAIFGHNRMGNSSSGDEIAAYDRLIWEGVLPSIRRACLSWDPRLEMHQMIELIEQWIPILPIWIKENILEQLVVPRIAERVNEWDPMTDIVPIHEWLVPWNYLLGDRIQAVMPPIRQKLAKALKQWDPMDGSALATLRPWQNVWSTGTFTAFIGQNIVPKLGQLLDNFQLDPTQNPHYPEWPAVMEWLELVHPDAIANIVTKYFFPRFYTALCSWLDSPGVNYAEVKNWYGSWKSRIPEQIVNYPTVSENLRRAVLAIGSSLQGNKVSNMASMAPSTPMIVPQIPQMMAPSAPIQQLSMKETIEALANRNGFTYHPQRDRYCDGRQVFWFGAVSIYMDTGAGMVYVMDPMEFNWRPAGIEELVRLAQGNAQ